MLHLAAIIAGFILDLIFGDPHWLPHPICLIGNLIGFIERNLRPRLAPNKLALLLGGFVMVTLANTEIREAAKRNGVRLWQVAEVIGIADATFSRKLSRDLPASERERVMTVIEKLAGEGREVS